MGSTAVNKDYDRGYEEMLFSPDFSVGTQRDTKEGSSGNGV